MSALTTNTRPLSNKGYSTLVDFILEDLFGPDVSKEISIASKNQFPKMNARKIVDENNKTRFVFDFALAGYSKENIKVKIDGEVFEVSCDHTNKLVPSENTEEIDYVREIAQRSFVRKIALPGIIRTDNPDVKFQDGLLSITFYEDAEKAPRYLEIK